MVFSSPIFLFIFLPVTFLFYKVLPFRLKNVFLVFVSLLFYAWGEPVFVLLMIVSVCANYFFARLIGEDPKENRRAKTFLVCSIVFNLGMLFVFKYSNFFVYNVNYILDMHLQIPKIRLPIGISFYTFQAMSYVIDVYRKITKPQKKLTYVFLYISFFPQLIAGPIVLYADIAAQIEKRTETLERTVTGLKRFSIGLGKKLLLANTMGLLADQVFAQDLSVVNLPVAWVGAVAYALQIYFDFSGYSDMALGLADLFGFELKENFRYPYMSSSIKEFWRRWHISLSTWFKDYLYIPLGGNRKGKMRTVVNLLIVFFCTGLWHGAEWTFVVWGLFHGFFIMSERVGLIKPEKFRPKWLAHAYALTVVVVTFVIFRATTLSQGFRFVGKMFAGFSFRIESEAFLRQALTAPVLFCFVLAIIGATSLPRNAWGAMKLRLKGHSPIVEAVSMTATLCVLVLCIFALSGQTYNPFIYFRF